MKEQLNPTDEASFTWSYGVQFLLETNKGYFVWNDPRYGGDNTIRRFLGNYEDWIRYQHIPYGRDKGKHLIKFYCPDARILQEEIVP